eukprot:SAG22_NODE_434_length_10555_cov_3.917559_6_plen_140_part_00
MAGCKNDPSIEGFYAPDGQSLNGHAVYGHTTARRLLFWVADGGGKWVIADTVNAEEWRAQEPDGASPDGDAGPHLASIDPVVWLTDGAAGWIAEPSVTVSVRQQLVHLRLHDRSQGFLSSLCFSAAFLSLAVPPGPHRG